MDKNQHGWRNNLNMAETSTYFNVHGDTTKMFFVFVLGGHPISHLPALRLALAFVFETFIHNQLLEDCEFASATPGEKIHPERILSVL